jgi:hypothetical protein
MITVNNICSFGLSEYFFREYPGQPLEPINTDQVNKCREYIKEYLKPDKRGHSSYHFKHVVENHYNYYISNGAFIQAALLENIRMERMSLHSPNVRIYLTYKRGEK